MATFPSAVKTFTDVANGDTVTDTLFDLPNAEITAIETFLRSSLFGAVNSSCIPVATAYTPTWTGSVSNPAILNGTLSGLHFAVGKLRVVSITLSVGSLTTFGSGSWSFSLPSGTASAGGFNWFAVDASAAGAGNKSGAAFLPTSTTVGFYHDASGGFGSSSIPFTWANGDSLSIWGWYFEA